MNKMKQATMNLRTVGKSVLQMLLIIGFTLGINTMANAMKLSSSIAATMSAMRTPCPPPDQPDVITGNVVICPPGSPQTYSIPVVTGATDYTWTLPSGWTGTSTITTIDATAGTVGGTITVTANNACGSSIPRTLDVVVNTELFPVITAMGPTSFCFGGSVILDAGAGYASYTWNTAGTDETITATASGTSSVTVTDNYGCLGVATQDIFANALPTPHILTFADSTFCLGDSVQLESGNFNLNALVPYTNWSWSSGEITEVVTEHAQGIYTVTVTDMNGCTGSKSVHVTVNPHPTPTITSASPFTSCLGGSIVLDAGVFPQYHWSTSNIGETITVSATNTYSVTVTNSNGCTGTASVNVNLLAGPAPTITGILSFCSNTPGTTLDAGTYTLYSWSNGGTDETTTATTAGTYTVTVTDNVGCTGTNSVTVTMNTSPTPSITPSGATSFCAGGSVSLDAGIFASYLWSSTATGEAITATANGTYIVTVTDMNGCTGSASQMVIVSPAINAVITASGATTFCAGGSVTLDAGTYTSYSWSNTATDQTIMVAASGIYSVTVTDNIGCTGIASQIVTANTNPTPTITPSGSTTFCSNTSITLDAGVYSSYLWSNAATDEIVTASSSAMWTVTVTDANGCTGTTSVTTTFNAAPSPVITPSGPTTFCSGGSVTLDAGVYLSYIWSNTETNEMTTVNTSSNFMVTVTAANGCTGATSQMVTANQNLNVNISASGPTSFCAGGTVILSPGFYLSYLWSDASTDATLMVNTAGTYSVTVTDGNGCTGVASQGVIINSNPTPTITPSGSTTFCSNNSIMLDAGVYASFIWNTSETNETITASTANTFSVTITDNNGCTGIASIITTVNIAPSISIAASGSTTFCNGGSVTLDAGSGFTIYTWNNTGTDQTTIVMTGGNYIITVTDANGCTGAASLMVTVNASPTPLITPSISANICAGTSETLDAGVYATYLWSTTGTDEMISVNASGNNSVTVTDMNGCTGSASLIITVNTNPTPSITPSGFTTFCDGGSITLDAGVYVSYIWSNTSTNQMTTVMTSSNYIVTVTDINGCTGIASQMVAVNSNPITIITASSSTTFCIGGSVTLDAGVFASYMWSNAGTDETTIVTTGGIYSLTITDMNGCTGIASQTVTVNQLPLPTITSSNSTTFCANGSIILDAGMYSTYLWSNTETDETIIVNLSGTFLVTVADGNGCTGIASITTTVNANPTPSITQNGAILNTGIYSSYLWSTGATTDSINVLVNGTYTVTVTDANGCTGVASMVVSSTACADVGAGAAYITNQLDNTVSVINIATNTVTATIPVGNHPVGVSVSPDGTKAYIANEFGPSISVINTATNTVSATISVSGAPYGIVVSPDGSKVYVANVSANSVNVINTVSNIVSTTIPVGLSPEGIAVSPDGTNVYVANQSDNAVSVITAATNTVSVTVPVGADPFGLVVSPDGSKVYVTNETGGTVSVITTATNTVSATINVGIAPQGISMSPDGSKAYVVNGNSNSVSVINTVTNTVSATIPVGSDPWGISVNSDGNMVYVVNDNFTGTVSVIDTLTNTVTATITVGSGPAGFGNFISASTSLTPVITANGNTTFCQGGSVTLDAGSYTFYLWSNGATTETITAIDSSNYSVTVTNVNGCTGVALQLVTVHANPIPSIAANGPTSFCNGGSVTLDAGNYTSYNWDDGDFTETTIIMNNGLSSVTVTDGNGCTGVSSQMVTVNPSPTPTISHSTPTTFCSGDSVVLDANVYLSYIWSTYATTRKVTATTGGTFSVTVTDVDGCTGVTSINVIVHNNPNPIITNTGSLTFCDGGSVILDAGISYTSYLWNTGETDQMETEFSGGTYFVIVTNGNNCTGSASIDVVNNPLPNPVITPNGPVNFCVGGSVTLDAGIFNSYIWSTTETTQSIATTNSGTYDVTVTDINGCTATASQVVVVSLNITFSITPTGPTTFCSGGSVTLDAGVYNSYNWSTSETTETISVSTSGTYTVTITGNNGCSGTSSITTVANPLPTPLITASGPISFCAGGSVTLDAGIYTNYIWSTTATTQTINSNNNGNYSVTVTDANGCTGSTSQTISVYANPIPSIISNNPTTFCIGSSTTLDAGSFSSYVWSSSETSETVTVSTAGTFMVTVTDSHGCTGSASQSIIVNTLPTPIITAIGPTSFCNGGSVNLDAGTFVFYNWSSAATTEIITAATNGVFGVTVTDNNGCTGITSQAVTVYSNPNPTITPNGPTSFCDGGMVDLNAGSFVSFAWNTGETDQIVTEYSNGTYLVTVTDSHGCTGEGSILVTVYSLPSPTITPSGPTVFCNGGSVTLNPGSYASYLWSTGATTASISATIAGTYSVTITDNHGCTGSASQTVTVNPLPIASITPNGPTSFCQGGSVVLDAGNALTYHWNTAATTESITVTVNGVYYVTISNGFNCTSVTSQVVTVTTNPIPVIFANGPVTFCAGDTVSLDAGVWSSYLWSTGATTETITETISGTYTVTVTNIGGCTGSTSSIVTVNTNPTAAITPSSTTTFCQGGSVFLNVGAYASFIWNTGATTGIILATNNGTYSVTVTDVNGCTAIASINVTVNANSTPVITPSGPISFCAGGSVNLDAGSYASYLWNTGSTIQTLSNINSGGTYMVTVTNGNGCTGTASILITVTVIPTPNIIVNGPLTFCSGTDSVQFDAGNFASYSWSTGATTRRIVVFTSGTYIVTVTNAGGCTGSSTRVVTVNPTPNPTIVPNGSVTFCIGGSVNLDAGVYPTYHWSTGATTETINNINTSGTYMVTVTSAAGCSATASQVVTVNALPTPIITANGPIMFCIGGSVTLNAGVGYTNYIWSTGATTNTINVSAAGTYHVTVTNNNGCTGFTSQTITVNPLPNPTITANGPLTFCSGGNIILDAGNWSTYLWNTTATTETITASSSGTYSVTITNNNGCSASTAQTVTVNPLPTVTDTSTLSNVCIQWAIFNLNGGIPAGGTYSGIGVVLNQFNPNLAGLGTRTITYIYTDGNGCTNSATHNLIVNPCTDVPTITDADFVTLFPNPNDGNFTVKYSVSTAVTAIRVVDITGRIVLIHTLSGIEGSQEINASDLAKGVYYYEVMTTDAILAKGKMVIVK